MSLEATRWVPSSRVIRVSSPGTLSGRVSGSSATNAGQFARHSPLQVLVPDSSFLKL